jgi:1-acyl-sn-glycerol-3-phosphate acyltransferase
MLYRLLKFIIGVGIRLYYKEIRVKNLELLPQKGPLIIISNHPNTLMDAWVIGMVCKQPIYYMAKATLFNSKFKLKLLKSLNMIPINRQGEGRVDGVSNEDSFGECYKILNEGKTLVIFPEGTSYKERVLRKLKSGTARIALEAEHRKKGKLGLKVVAVGLNYSQSEKFRSNILIDIDQPQPVTAYLEEYEKNSRSAAQKLTSQFRTRLEKVLVTNDTTEEESLVEKIYSILHSKNISSSERGVQREVTQLKDIKNRLDEMNIVEPWLVAEIHLKVRSIQWKLDKLKIKSDFLDRRFRSRMFYRQLFTSSLFIIVALPLFILGLIHNIFQYLFTDWIIPKLTKDIEYYAPFAVFIGIILYPSFYLLALYLIGIKLLALSTVGLVIYFALMPITGLFAYWLARYMKHVSNKWHYMFLMMDRKNVLAALKKDKIKLKNLIFEG